MTEIAGPPEERSYHSQVYFTKPRDVVFDALTSLSGLAGWWSPVTGSGTEGGELRFRCPRVDPLVIAVDAAERPRTVTWTVVSYPLNPDWVGTRITFSLTTSPNGTRLKFRHQGLTARLEYYTECSRGWDYVLPSLRDYVETGFGSPLD
jgi:uncharacterized protein YndB with AHSA1/START domain